MAIPLRIALFALVSALCAACTRDSSSGPGPEPEAIPFSIQIVGSTQSPIGGGALLAAIVLDSTGDTLWNQPVVWSNSDTTRVGMSLFRGMPTKPGAQGTPGAHLTPKRIAAVTITATLGSLRDSVTFSGYLPRIRFVFADTVPAAERLRIQDATQDALDFQKAALGRALQESTTVSALYTATGCAQGGSAAFTGMGAVTFCLGNQGWKAQGPVMKQKVVQHELFHAWQFEYGWISNPGTAGATWAIEGAAELMGFQGIVARGLISMDTALGCQVKESSDFKTQNPPGLPSLQTVESRMAFQTTVGPLYTHSMLAMQYLIQIPNSPEHDLMRLRAYGDSIKAGVAWQTAFQQAFVRTPSFFYNAFSGYVSGLTVPPTYNCRL